jgi:hypothetical protein
MKSAFMFVLSIMLLSNVNAQLFINGDITIENGAVLFANDSIKLSSSSVVNDYGVLQSTKGISTRNNLVNTGTTGFIITPIASGLKCSFDLGINSNNKISIKHQSGSEVVYQMAVRNNSYDNPEKNIGNILDHIVAKTWIVKPMSNSINTSVELNWNTIDEQNNFNRHNCGISKWEENFSNAWAFTNGTTSAASNPSGPNYSQTTNLGNLNVSNYYLGMGDSSSTYSVYLRSTIFSSGSLNPVFSSLFSNYSSSVSSSTNSLLITPTANDLNASIQISVNGSSFQNTPNAAVSSPISLNLGINSILIKVIGTDGITNKVYSFNVTRGSVSAQLSLVAYLEAYYQANGNMTCAPFNADGITSALVADTITVELHQALGNHSLVYATMGLLKVNGGVDVSFPPIVIGNSYYIVLKHRNSIETWSALPVTINSATNYDFSSAASQAFGDNLSSLGNSKFAIYTGDINQDGSIDFNDYPSIDIASSIGVLGYDSNDLNGDASVDFNDYPLLDINSSNGIIAIRP